MEILKFFETLKNIRQTIQVQPIITIQPHITIQPQPYMKTFKDLTFNTHPVCNGLQALCFFANGFGVSVVRFRLPEINRYGSYTDNESEWELAILYGDEKKWEITYNTPITNDVLGHLLEADVTEIMKQVQNLPI